MERHARDLLQRAGTRDIAQTGIDLETGFQAADLAFALGGFGCVAVEVVESGTC
jgi:hypothetical protein